MMSLVSSAPEESLSHTRNKKKDGTPKYLNRLILETSPYLMQHAFNPVDWMPFGPEALARARALDRPIFLSVGYATCHWCHVMARESFEDSSIAEFINANYVPIKVDREERPDLDRVYMSVVTMLTGRGGWPMTVILTPELEPLFGGTYFPPRDRRGRKGFLSILQEIHGNWSQDPQGARQRAGELAARMVRRAMPQPPTGLPVLGVTDGAASRFVSRQDATMGGFGRAPKFPRPPALFFLTRFALRKNDHAVKKAVERTLDAIATGGIHDQVGGGFHRYSVDNRWKAPHFEKMLYGNAQLARVYLEAGVAFNRSSYLWVARRTLDYMLRELRAPDGGFVSATDADSAVGDPHGKKVEGHSFTWTREELNQELGDKLGAEIAKAFNVSLQGNFEHGRSIFHLPGPWEAPADQSLAKAQKHQPVLERLWKVRGLRPQPETDGKRVTAWNALTISALVRGTWVLGDSGYLKVAQDTAKWMLKMVWKDGGLYRTYHLGRPGSIGVLSDYAFFVQALLDLFEADGDPRWLDSALAIQKAQDENFLDPAWGGYYHIPPSVNLLVRRTPDWDGAEPSGNSISAYNLHRLWALTSKREYQDGADALLKAFGRSLSRGGTSLPMMMDAMTHVHLGARQVVVVAPEGDDQGTKPFQEVLNGVHAPDISRLIIDGGSDRAALAARVPWTAAKDAKGGKTTAYVCRESVCKRPTSDLKLFRAQLLTP